MMLQRLAILTQRDQKLRIRTRVRVRSKWNKSNCPLACALFVYICVRWGNLMENWPVYQCNHPHHTSSVFWPEKTSIIQTVNSTVMDVVSCLQHTLCSLSLSPLLSHVFPPQFLFFSILSPRLFFAAIPTSLFLHLNCLLKYIWTTLILFVCSFLHQNSILHCVYPVEANRSFWLFIYLFLV